MHRLAIVANTRLFLVLVLLAAAVAVTALATSATPTQADTGLSNLESIQAPSPHEPSPSVLPQLQTPDCWNDTEHTVPCLRVVTRQADLLGRSFASRLVPLKGTQIIGSGGVPPARVVESVG